MQCAVDAASEAEAPNLSRYIPVLHTQGCLRSYYTPLCIVDPMGSYCLTVRLDSTGTYDRTGTVQDDDSVIVF